ncbi:COP9 signalosome (CSN) subunit [Thoreauomyces humboldtii]|nr:COP9 signalosome (CSN) subunit [Thoreauomyces humboldtii]
MTSISRHQETVENYLTLFTLFLEREEGKSLADLLSLKHSHAQDLHVVMHGVKPKLVETAVRKALEEQWADVVWQHLKAIKLVKAASSTGKRKDVGRDGTGIGVGDGARWRKFDGDAVQAAEVQNLVAQNFHQVFANQTRWCLPVLYAIDGDLRALSIEADEILRRTGQKTGYLEQAARALNKAFSYCVTDRFSIPSQSRKWGTYHIVNLLFMTYFRLTQTNLCASILRSLKAGDLPPIDRFPIPDQLTFRYHVGVLAFYNEEYKKAEEDLAFALYHCSPRTIGDGGEKNKLLILNYLLPTRLILGTLPDPRLLTAHPALNYLYAPFVLAIRTGDVRLFDASLYALQTELVDRGTYLTVERAREVCVRMLFKKVWLLHDRGSRIAVGRFAKALELAGCDEAGYEDGAVACMLANMIDKGYLKGYISHEKQMVVLSPKEPFPSVKVIAAA